VCDQQLLVASHQIDDPNFAVQVLRTDEQGFRPTDEGSPPRLDPLDFSPRLNLSKQPLPGQRHERPLIQDVRPVIA
jgi:hypothetical protein